MTWSCTLTRWSTHGQPVRLFGQRTTSSSSMVSTILGTGCRSLADSTGRRQVGQVLTGCCCGAQACSRHSRQKKCSQGSWTGRSKGAWQIRQTRFGSGSVVYSRAAISGGTLRHLLLRRFDEGEWDARSANGEGLLGGPPTTRNSDGSDSASASFDARELRRPLGGGMGDGDDMAIAMRSSNAEKQCGGGGGDGDGGARGWRSQRAGARWAVVITMRRRQRPGMEACSGDAKGREPRAGRRAQGAGGALCCMCVVQDAERRGCAGPPGVHPLRRQQTRRRRLLHSTRSVLQCHREAASRSIQYIHIVISIRPTEPTQTHRRSTNRSARSLT
jgi:hypothetical protein